MLITTVDLQKTDFGKMAFEFLDKAKSSLIIKGQRFENGTIYFIPVGPGVSKENVDVSFTNNDVKVIIGKSNFPVLPEEFTGGLGKPTEDLDPTYFCTEQSYQFAAEKNIEASKARISNGVLIIKVLYKTLKASKNVPLE